MTQKMYLNPYIQTIKTHNIISLNADLIFPDSYRHVAMSIYNIYFKYKTILTASFLLK